MCKTKKNFKMENSTMLFFSEPFEAKLLSYIWKLVIFGNLLMCKSMQIRVDFVNSYLQLYNI